MMKTLAVMLTKLCMNITIEFIEAKFDSKEKNLKSDKERLII